MVKIIIQQENEDGTKTIAFKDPEGKSMISVITAKTPHVIDKQLVVKDKLKDTLNKITEEISERMLIVTILSESSRLLTKVDIYRRVEPTLGYPIIKKHLLVLEKIGLVQRKSVGRLSLYYTEKEGKQ